MLALHGKNYVPLICLRPSLAYASGAFESMRFSDSHVIQIDGRVISTYTPPPLRLGDCTPNPTAVIDVLSMNPIDDKIERAEIAVVEVFAQFELFFLFVFF